MLFELLTGFWCHLLLPKFNSLGILTSFNFFVPVFPLCINCWILGCTPRLLLQAEIVLYLLSLFLLSYNLSVQSFYLLMSSRSSSNLVSKTVNYLRDVQREGRQISWPSLNYATSQFFVVLVLSSLLTCLLYLIDIGLLKSINALKETFIK